jgi:hypothetical protein
MIDWYFLIAVLIVGLAMFAGLQIARFLAHGQWHEAGKHSCGHIDQYGRDGNVCGKCGERNGWKKVIVRAKFPFGWQEKPE